MIGKIGSEIEIEGSVDVFIVFIVLFMCVFDGFVEGFEWMVVDVIGDNVDDLSVD